MGQTNDALIEREEILRYAHGRCAICGEWLQQGEEDICDRHVADFERD